MNHVAFVLNGTPVELSNVSPTTTLLQALRGPLELPGTKEGCAEGDCGACTVVVVDRSDSKNPKFRAVNSCLFLLPMAHGLELYTVEGLADDEKLHLVQDALKQKLGSQCGYCTPGVVMSLFEACYRGDMAEPWQVDDQMCGNLCRCTGYRPIREAAEDVAGKQPDDRFRAALANECPKNSYKGNDEFAMEAAGQRFYAPASLDSLWKTLADHPEAVFVQGGTDVGLRVTKRFEKIPVLVSLERLPELRVFQTDADCWEVGAGVRLSDLETAANEKLPSLARALRYFGARQIKNRGTVGGNLCNASPIGDMAPLLLALDADVSILSKQGERRIPLSEFFLGYRKTALAEGEILGAIRFKVPSEQTKIAFYKVSKRQELDISAVAAALRVELDASERVVSARFAFGGMAATPIRAKEVEDAVRGLPWNEETANHAARLLETTLKPISDHRGSSWYRQRVAGNLMRGFFFETRVEPSPRPMFRPTGTHRLPLIG